YASAQDFATTNILPFPLDESTGGFTDFYRRRVVLPFQGDPAVMRHVLDHELVHAFQFDILQGERLGSMPLWLMEGMAEYLSSGWDQTAETYVRDAVLNNRMPELVDLHNESVNDAYAYYKGGQAVMMFIADTYGIDRIPFLLRAAHNTNRIDEAIRLTFKTSANEFNLAFARYLRARYALASRAYAETKDLRMREVTDRYESQTGFQIRPAVSPDGQSIAYLTVDGIFPAIVIRPAPGPGITKKRQETKKIVLRALRSSDYEEVQLLTTKLSYSPDGKSLMVAGRRQGQQSILFFDVDSGDLIESESHALPLDSIAFPSMSPDGSKIVFSGTISGKTDLYILEKRSGMLRRLTSDARYESSPVFSNAGDQIYFSASSESKIVSSQIYRFDLASGKVFQITNIPGQNGHAISGQDGSILFLSTQDGVSNVFLLEHASTLTQPSSEVSAITASLTGIFDIAGAGEKGIVFTERVEGASEVRLMPDVRTTQKLDENLITFHAKPAPMMELERQSAIRQIGGEYSPFLAIEGMPFVFVTAAGGPDGKTSVAALGFMSLADESGDHRLSTLVSYNARPAELNLNLEYAYLKYRTDFFVGAYRQSGIFAVFNFLDFSLNSLLYNPYFRVLDQNTTGAYGGFEYPLHSFGSISLVMSAGREERIYDTVRPEEKQQPDLFQNHQSLGFAYQYNNIVYSMYGPLDGHAFLFQYSVPVQFNGRDRELYVTTTEFRFHHLFDNYSSLALRAFGATASGRDASLYPFQIGGYYTIRGYRFLEFEGKHAFVMNLDYHFNFIEALRFGVPFSWSPGPVRGALFFDAGSAFDRPQDFQGYSRKSGTTRDLHLSFGAGIHWANFLWFLIPGALMKIEWATPYDTKRSLPLSKWKGAFSVGFNF
ncbi:MAG TPA: BamA/TamA family outer membrane protein, partial [Leptospiraceae bacterium]|nr:BamA/TamA family outer membrane protein [Leptospiraceae bacterium]